MDATEILEHIAAMSDVERLKLFGIAVAMRPSHEHCMHAKLGPVWMVLPNGHVPVKCCKCGHEATEHGEHLKWSGYHHAGE